MLSEIEYDGLISGIYDAAADVTLLPSLLDGLRRAFNGSSAALIAFADEPGLSRVTATHPEAVEVYRRDWDARNPLHPSRRREGILLPGAAATDRMMMPRESLVRTPYFNEFLQPYDLPHLLAVKLESGKGSDVTLNLFRGQRQEEFDTAHLALARRLAGHLRGAARLASRLAWAGLRAEGTDAALDRLASGTILLDTRGRILHMSAVAARMLAVPDGLRIEAGQLAAVLPAEEAALARLIGRAAAGASGDRGGALTISRPSGRRAWVVAVAPVRLEVGWLAPRRPAAVVSITDPEHTPALAADRLSELYGFTAREAEVALGIASGLELKDVAGSLGLTVLSARQYLSRALQKSGAHRQHDLTRLLVTLGMTAG